MRLLSFNKHQVSDVLRKNKVPSELRLVLYFAFPCCYSFALRGVFSVFRHVLASPFMRPTEIVASGGRWGSLPLPICFHRSLFSSFLDFEKKEEIKFAGHVFAEV